MKRTTAPNLPLRLAVADTHLSAAQPARTALFYKFLCHEAARANELYLLGDIFDVWLGDDDNSALAVDTAREIAAISAAGVRVCIQTGNRDFLLGRRFCDATGAQLLADEYAVAGTLLMHGDTLCGDATYRCYRRIVRSAAFASVAGVLPLPWRRWLARGMRRESQKRRQPAVINCVQAAEAMRRHGCTTLAHGHTHTPGQEKWTVDGRLLTRCCLPDWETAAGYAELRADGIQLIAIG